MNIKELRIGNFVQSLSIVRVTSLDGHFINGYSIGGYSPIPLTKELLLKCGFEIHDMTDFEHGYVSTFYKEEFGYMKSNYALCVNNTDIHSDWDNITEIGRPMKYLHQLQNLYFDLTGEELEVVL